MASSGVLICKLVPSSDQFYNTFAYLWVAGVYVKCEFCSYKKRYEQMTDNVGSILAGSLWGGWWTLQRCPLILCPTTLLRLFVQSLATTQLFNTCLPESKEHPNGINELCVKMIFFASKEF